MLKAMGLKPVGRDSGTEQQQHCCSLLNLTLYWGTGEGKKKVLRENLISS